MTNTRNTPIEAFERAYPMRVSPLAIRCGSGGAGLVLGGDGMVKEIAVLEDYTVSLVFERRISRYRLRRGSGGAGLAPGGDGIERDLQVLEDCTISLSRIQGFRRGSGWRSSTHARDQRAPLW